MAPPPPAASVAAMVQGVVLIVTDTQQRRLVGSYGERWVDTPNLDALAAQGRRLEHAYAVCPLCTPARGALFTGLHPQVNGAWANEMTVARHVPLLGEWLRGHGRRAAYTGKWHLDGAGYHGGGRPDGGFEGDWWYDGETWMDEIGHERARALARAIGPAPAQGLTAEWLAAARAHDSAAALRALAVRDDEVWGHRVADRAIDFLERIGGERFLLVVAFDEPHGPFVTPPAFQERLPAAAIPCPPNFAAPLAGKPRMQQVQAAEFPVGRWEDFALWRQRHVRCNAWIDRQIGRVVAAADRLVGADGVAVVATTDHGDMMGAHGLLSKGAMMYDETVRIPCIVRAPGIASGSVGQELCSQLDLLPTICDWLDVPPPPRQHGRSLRGVFAGGDPGDQRAALLLDFNRFGLHHAGYAAFYPIRCAVDARWKLALNLFDRDELYDRASDPHELVNRIDDPACAGERDRLHAWLLAEMERIHDPLRGHAWAERPWAKAPAWRFHVER